MQSSVVRVGRFGRPRLAAARKRKGRMTFRATDDEWYILTAKAKAAGVSIHEYVWRAVNAQMDQN